MFVGHIAFDEWGIRTDFSLEIVELRRSGLEKIGHWHDQHGVSFDRADAAENTDPDDTIENKTIIVTTIKVNCDIDNNTSLIHVILVSSIRHVQAVSGQTPR